MRGRRLLLLGSILVAVPALAAEPRPFDTVVAVVDAGGGDERKGRTVVTLSELQLEARIAIVSRGGAEAATAELPPETLAASLDWLVAELLLAEEAEQLAVGGVEGDEVAKAIERFRDRLGGVELYRAFLARNELSEADLGRILRRSLSVGRYLDSRSRLAAAVAEDDVRRTYEEKKRELGGAPYEEVAASLRARLEKERRERSVAALVADVRGRADVRILHDLGVARKPRETPRPTVRGDPLVDEGDGP